MRIAFFHNLPDGGAKRVIFEQVKYLSNNNIITVYEIENKENFFDLKSLDVNVKRYNFDMEKPIFGIKTRIVKDLNNFYALRILHKKIAEDIDNELFDIVIVHPDKFTQAPFILNYLKTSNIYYCEELLRIGYESQFKFDKKVFFANRIYENITRMIRKNIDYRNARAADFIIANSKFTSNNIKIAYSKNSFICYPGVDEKSFKPQYIKKIYDILFIGEKTTFDGHDLLQKVIKLFAKKPVVRIISRDKGKYYMSDKSLVKEYNRSKLTAALSSNEPFGFIPLESMACSVPVVALDEGGFSETILNNKTGLLVGKNPIDIYNAFYSVLNNDFLRKKMSNKSRKYILSSWTWDKSITNLLTIINKCLKKRLKN